MRIRWALGLALALLPGGAALAQQAPPPAKPPVRLIVTPRATHENRVAPGGTTFGTSTPHRNATMQVHNPPRSPTPPGFPFGPPGGSWAPGGAAISGPAAGFTNTNIGQ